MKNKPSSLVSIFAAAAIVGTGTVSAANKDWSDTNGGIWSSNSNWSGALNFPQGDSARFPNRGNTLVPALVTFDLDAGTDINGITFTGGSWKIQGATMDLDTGITSAGNNEVSCLIQIFPNVTFSSSSGRLRLGSVSLLGRTATFSVNTDAKISPGVISGTGAGSKIIKKGAGSLVMNSANTFQGTATIEAGTLEGSGTVPNVVLAGGTLSPGEDHFDSTATMTMTSLSATQPSGLKLEFARNVAGDQISQDQIVLTGTANLANISLEISAGGLRDIDPTLEFILISKTSTGLVTGTFTGLPEGAFVNVGGTTMEISYKGGVGGNDVVLRPRTTPVTLTWTLGGSGNGSKWSDPASWQANGPAQAGAGDNLVFPQLTGLIHHPNAVNDLQNAVIGSITISGNNYSIGGGSLGLKTGITLTDFLTQNTVGFFNTVAGVTANGPIFIRNESNVLGMMLAVLQINANGSGITVDGDGKAYTRVSLKAGNGSLIKGGTVMAELFDSLEFTGPITVNQGVLKVFGDLGSPATATTINAGGTVQLQGGGTQDEPFNLNGGTLSGLEAPDPITLTGAITTTAADSALAGHLSFANDIRKFLLSVNVPITGTGGLRVTNGAVEFLQPTQCTGAIKVRNGHALFMSTHTSSDIIAGTETGVTTNSGPFVMGTGTLKKLTVNDGARLDPGVQSATVGTLTLTGQLIIGTDGNYLPTMGSTSADKVVVNSTVNVQGRLRPVLAQGFQINPGAAFVIIENDGTDVVTGKFRGADGATPASGTEVTLEEGALVRDQSGTVVFRISYVGGTGNDVTLTHVSN